MGKTPKKSPHKNNSDTTTKSEDQSNVVDQPEKVSPTGKRSKSVEREPAPEVVEKTKSSKKQKKEKKAKVESTETAEATEQTTSLADFFASKNSEQNESLFSAFSQIATTTATPAPKVDVQQFVQHERQKIDKVQKDVEREEKYEAADIEKQIDAEIKEQEKAERFLSAEQKSERDKRSIFIGNVTTAVAPKKISKELKKQFSKYGTVQAIRFRSVAFARPGMNKVGWIRQELHTKRDNMNAYLVFEKEESVEKALVENGALVLGKHIRVDYANHDPKREKFTAFVGNLPYDCTEETVRAHFADCGGITNVHIVRATGVGIGKGVAFVSFVDQSTLKSALAKDGGLLGTRPLRVCRPSTKDKKQRDEKKEKMQAKENNKRKHGEQKSSKTSKKVKTNRYNADGTPSWQGAKANEGQSTKVIKKINKHKQFQKKKESN